jgi:hypothetical protein
MPAVSSPSLLAAFTSNSGRFAAADATLSSFWVMPHKMTVDAGASIDLAGVSTIISDLRGGGAVIDRGATATSTLGAANFLGRDLGPAVARLQRQRVADRCPDLAPSGFSTAPPVGSAAAAYASRKESWPRRRQEGNSR